MKVNKFVLIAILVLVQVLKVWGQDASSDVDLKNFNSSLLSELILQEINSARDSLSVNPLSSDELLEKAAQNHAKYLITAQKLTHFQSKEKYKDPKKRVDAFNGKHQQIAENIAFTNVNSQINSPKNSKAFLKTYGDVAKHFVNQWLNSPPHLKNIKFPFTNTGIAVSIDSKSNIIYAVQVFGSLSLSFKSELQVPKDIYGIKNPSEKKNERCNSCFQVLSSKPEDVRFGIQRENNFLYFVMNDLNWFHKLFDSNGDGVAIDIVFKKQFPCSQNNDVPSSWAYRGLLLKPVYKNELVKYNVSINPSEIAVKIGEVPYGMENEEVEFNMLLLKNKFLCYYNNFYDIPGHKWDLLEMGLFMDTLTEEKLSETSYLISKGVKFVIPFEKDKFEYSPKDIKPLYDSLHLNRFDIKSISLRAYASVEGSTEHNLVLQQKRAESIINALQSFQLDTITKDILTSENWVEFMDDISSTRYSHFKDFSKTDIKKSLEDKQVSLDLENILSKHRKAILHLNVEIKGYESYNNPSKAKKLFEQALAENKIKDALEIQKILFSKVKSGILPSSLLDSLEIPQKVEYGLLLNNQSAFKFIENENYLYTALKQFEKLEEILPHSPQIKYNICVLKLKSALIGDQVTDFNKLRHDIQTLEKYKVDRRLIKRLLINYAIIMSEYLIKNKRYSDKDKMVKYIYDNYKDLNPTEEDAINLAQYFVEYSKYEWATALLTPYARKVDINEDLLFYYLNLTIIKEDFAKKPYFKTVLLNAININRDRYCRLFNSNNNEGITFQLLSTPLLKKMYCENCY